VSESGSFQEGPESVEITGVGAGAYDGWQVVMEFDDLNLPNGKNREGMFIIVGSVGHNDAGGAVKAKIQIGLREKGLVVPLDQQVQILPHSAQQLQAKFGVLQGIPFQHSLAYIQGARGKYQPTGVDRRLQLVARTFRDGDPSSIKPVVRIFKPRMMFWDLTTLGSSNYFHELYSPANGSAAGIAANNVIKVNHQSSALPFDATIGQEDWLVFQRITYEPTTASVGGPLSPPVLEFAYGAPPLSTVRVKNPGAANPESIYRDMKWFARDKVGANVGIRETFSDGGIEIVTIKDNNTITGIRSWDPLRPTSGGTIILSAEWFGVRLRALPRVAYRNQRDNRFTTTSGKQLFNGAKFTGQVHENFEPLLKGVTGNLMIAAYSQNTRARGKVPARASSVTESIVTNKGLLYGSGLYFVAKDRGRLGETPGHLCLATQKNVGTDEPQIRHFGREHFLSGKHTSGWYGMDTRLCAWHFELDPEVFRRNRKKPPPPSVVVIPGREAADLSSLLALPVEPESVTSEQIDTGGENSLDTPGGYKLHWPIFSAARAIVEFSFHVGETERLALIDFFEAQSARAFKWTPRKPGATPVAYALTEGPREAQLSPIATPDTTTGMFRLTVRCVQLIWTGVNV
jgi:hypothetical protein